jgi:RHS repeat-associated protein
VGGVQSSTVFTYGYEFDRIGNHLVQDRNGTESRGRYSRAKRDGLSKGAQRATEGSSEPPRRTATPSLNQLLEREIAGAVRVQGAAAGVLPIGVTVDGRQAETQNVDADTAAFRGDSPIAPRSTGEKTISVVAVDAADPPRRTENVRTVELPPENPVPYTYDAQAQTWTLSETRTFVYDLPAVPAPGTQSQALQAGQWNCIFERRLDATQTVTDAAYVWGLDLSGTLQGAGGVGGLLQASQNVGGALRAAMFFVYDGNGNVTALVDAADGSVVARYDYSPFGMTVLADGSAAAANPWCFSTKYHDTETALVYCGFRYYSPELGRWINRDPIGERVGVGLYAIVGNTPQNGVDHLGLYDVPGSPLLNLLWDRFIEPFLSDWIDDLVVDWVSIHFFFTPVCPVGEYFVLRQIVVAKTWIERRTHTMSLDPDHPGWPEIDTQERLLHNRRWFFSACARPCRVRLESAESGNGQTQWRWVGGSPEETPFARIHQEVRHRYEYENCLFVCE